MTPNNFAAIPVIGTLEINDFDFTRNQSIYLPSTPLPAFGASRKLYLGDLAVQSSMRRKGIASSLLMMVDKIAQANDYEEIYLHVDKEYSSLLSFYRRHGYHEEEFCEASRIFTEHHLQSPADNYLFLCKKYDLRSIR